jgi:protein TonB
MENTSSDLLPDILRIGDSGTDDEVTQVAAVQASMQSASRKVTPATLISKVNPEYPELARRSRTSASVVLDLEIDEQGYVVKAVPVTGSVLFHEAAVEAVLQWRYKPASIGGRNVRSQCRVTIAFNLN